MEKYEELREKLINVGDTGTMQCFGESMQPIIKNGSVLTFRKEESYQVGDIVFCEITITLNREQKVKWFIRNYLLEKGFVVEEHFIDLMEELKDKDLSNFEYGGETYSIPNQIDTYIDAHMIIKEEDGKFLIGSVNTVYGVNGWTDRIFGRVIGSYVEDNEEYFDTIRPIGEQVLQHYWPDRSLV